MNTHFIGHYEHADHSSDEQLWDLFRSGDQEAFSKIYDAHVDGLYNYGMNFTKDSFLVKEVIQDLFVTIWSTRGQLGQTSNIRFYLMRALRRKISVFHKDQKKWESDATEDKFGLAQLLSKKSFEQFNKSNVSEKEVAEKLKLAMERLPLRQREALYHIYYEDLSYEEVAALMNVNIKTVYNLAWRGIEGLRKNLSKASIFYVSPILAISALKLSADLLKNS